MLAVICKVRLSQGRIRRSLIFSLCALVIDMNFLSSVVMFGAEPVGSAQKTLVLRLVECRDKRVEVYFLAPPFLTSPRRPCGTRC